MIATKAEEVARETIQAAVQSTLFATTPTVITRIEVVTATPSPTPSPPQEIIDILDECFNSSAELLINKNAPVCDNLVQRAFDVVSNETNELRDLFRSIENPKWEIQVLRTQKLKEGFEVYRITVDHTISFNGQFECQDVIKRIENTVLTFDQDVLKADLQEFTQVSPEGEFSITKVNIIETLLNFDPIVLSDFYESTVCE